MNRYQLHDGVIFRDGQMISPQRAVDELNYYAACQSGSFAEWVKSSVSLIESGLGMPKGSVTQPIPNGGYQPVSDDSLGDPPGDE